MSEIRSTYTGWIMSDATGELAGPQKIAFVQNLDTCEQYFEAMGRHLPNFEVVVREAICSSCLRIRKCIWTIGAYRHCTECLARWQKLITDTDKAGDNS